MYFEKKLENSMVLRNVRDEHDIARFASFNYLYNNPDEGCTCDCLLRHHPETTIDDYWYIEALDTGHIVATSCLIPWTCSFQGIEIQVAMLEMVLTHPDYRKKGLSRTLYERFREVAQSRNFDLYLTWGIPYYYRQYGYSYAIEGNSFESLFAWQIPDTNAGEFASYLLRRAELKDIPQLIDFYNQNLSSLDIGLMRSGRYWEYLLQRAKYPVEILENNDRGIDVGYAVITDLPQKQGACVLEDGLVSKEAAFSFLQLLKQRSNKRVLIGGSGQSSLCQISRSLGSLRIYDTQWLLQIPDISRFLIKLAPIFQDRLERSEWRELNINLVINLYKEAFMLQFEVGKLIGVKKLGFVNASMGTDGGHLCIPLDAFVRLVFGFRILDELRDAWPDITLKAEREHLINVLFPRLQACLQTPYHYKGPFYCLSSFK